MFDYIIVTHIPAFYKVNLYNQLAEKLKLFVIFIAANTNEKRSDDFVTLKNTNFNYEILCDGDLQSRNVKSNIKKLQSILKQTDYKRILVSGWDLKEFWYLVMFYPKFKTCLALESTILESNIRGIKGWIKRFFLSRIARVFASGNLHVDLLNALNFDGEIKITKGVGIINKPIFKKATKEYQNRFLYIGRLTKVKNLEALIYIFNDLPNYHLTIIGDGEEKTYLQSIANQNIVFKAAIENSKLYNEFLNNDIFILPSLIEPWGLVVEEALYFHLPVLISKQCGACELIAEQKNGFIFDPRDLSYLKELILRIDKDIYNDLMNYVNSFNLDFKDIKQVEIYL